MAQHPAKFDRSDPNNNSIQSGNNQEFYGGLHTQKSIETGSTLVKRSFSLNSLRSHRSRIVNPPSFVSEQPDVFRNDYRLSFGSKNKLNTQTGHVASGVELPADIVAQLEADTLHGNLRRDSFRSRGGSKHFVMNPLFDDEHGDSVV